MITLGDKILPKKCQNSAQKFYCNFCDYGTSKKSSYDTHINSHKHKMITYDYAMRQNSAKILPNLDIILYACSCGKQYQHRQNLWRHKRNCKICIDECNYDDMNSQIDIPQTNNMIGRDDLIMELLKQNKELLEIVKNGTHNTTHTNSHNKAFNLNFFLNETCKNAMNITEFIDSIKLQLSDLIDVGNLGYVEGISKIIVNNLNNLDETVRPIHCTDKKRETFYVKDDGQWEKEDDQQRKIKKVIKNVANKNIKLLPQFREKYPEYSNSTSKISDKYDKMVIEVMETDPEKDEKIIKIISKATTIKEK